MGNAFEKVQENKNSLLVECEGCKNKFEINVSNGTMKLKERFETNNGFIYLSYYICPKCNKYHYVQIDNKSTTQQFNDLQRQFIKLAVAKRKGKSVPIKQRNKLKKSHNKLASSRRKLMEEYEGRTLIGKEGEEFILRFSQ